MVLHAYVEFVFTCVERTEIFNEMHTLLFGQDVPSRLKDPDAQYHMMFIRAISPWEFYSYGHLSVITGYKWDYTFYNWGFVSTYNW